MTATTHPDRVPGKLDPVVSERIRIARTICIFLMMFVHVQAGVADDVNQRPADDWFDIVYFILTRIFGLSSVALLTIVSGYLIVSTLHKLGAVPLIRSKARTLLVPLVAWNLVMLGCLAAYGVLTGKWDAMPALEALPLADALLALTQWPQVVPLWFLRDLFVCCLLSPLLLWGLRRAPLASFGAVAAFAFLGDGALVLQRPPMLLFFAAGMWLRQSGMERGDIDRLSRPIALLLLPVIAVFLGLRLQQGSIAAYSETASTAFDMALRFSMAAFMWQLTIRLSRLRFGALCRELEPYVFFAFCSHAILFDFGQIILRRAFGNYGSDLFPITFFALPIVAMATSVVALQLIRGWPGLLAVLNAGRPSPAWPPRLVAPAPARALPEARQRRT